MTDPTLHIRKSTQAMVLVLVFLSHLLSVAIPANANMQALHTNNNPDLAPICNGSGTIKWISLSQYYQTGQLVFIDISEPLSSDNQQIKCPLCTLAHLLDDSDAIINTPCVQALFSYQPPYSSLNFQRFGSTAKANARAPPLTC